MPLGGAASNRPPDDEDSLPVFRLSCGLFFQRTIFNQARQFFSDETGWRVAPALRALLHSRDTRILHTLDVEDIFGPG